VTLTIGLNDDKLAYALLAACQVPGDSAPTALCRQVLATTPAVVDSQLTKAAARVKGALQLIRHKAPKARIVLVGYPRYFPDSGSCPDRIPMAEAMVPTVRTALDTVNRKWRQVAGAVGADYVDTWTMSKGHDVCSADPWVNGATAVQGKAAALHPFERFHRAVADAVVDLLEHQDTPAVP
jgi:hypothetical protein